MCGILAAFNQKRPLHDFEMKSLLKGLEVISYRGPDASSHKCFTSKSLDGNKANIFLGHNRLSIIDLSDEGTQPFTNDDNYHIIFNGEIYNYVELRSELINIGYNFKTKTDTEVILNLYKEYGLSAFSKLNGMWAIIIYDSIKNKLVISRDRFSIKPLYYSNIDGTMIFASEIKQLLLFEDESKINTNVFGNYLHSYIVDYSYETFYQGIHKIPPRHTMSIDLHTGVKETNEYWNFTEMDLYNRSDEDLCEEYRELFYDAVKVRLRSDVKVGNTLSGGLDSSSIAVVADQISDNPITNISVVTDNKEASEEYFVDILKDESNLVVRKINIDQMNPWSDLNNVIWHNDEPILSLSTVAHFRMMKKFKSSTDITVILSGQGGDESLAGYNKYFFYDLKESLKNRSILQAFNSASHIARKLGTEFSLSNAKRYLSPSLRPKSIIDSVATFDFDNAFTNTASNFRERQLLDINKFSVPALTHYEDRSSMHQSLEIRLPFLDYRLVNFSINLPIRLKIRNGYTKYILRKSIKQLPEKIAWRKDKKGFTLNENQFYTPQSKQWIKSQFKSSVLSDHGLIDGAKFIKELELFFDGKNNFWSRDVNRIIFAELWAKQFIDGGK